MTAGNVAFLQMSVTLKRAGCGLGHRVEAISDRQQLD